MLPVNEQPLSDSASAPSAVAVAAADLANANANANTDVNANTNEPAFVDEALQPNSESLVRRDAPAADPTAAPTPTTAAAPADNSTAGNSINSINSINSNQFVAANSLQCSSPSYITSATTLYTNYPGSNYANYQTCTWYIVAPSGSVPRLTFSSFRTEQGFDFLTVYNGFGASSSTQVLRTSGAVLPAGVTGTSQYMTVTFTSDLSVVMGGVVASVSFVPVGGCSSPTYITSSGSVIDSNPGSTYYANGQSCTWYITAPAGYAPQLSFVRFNTESGFDYLTAYNGPSTSYAQLLRTSGSNLPSTTTATQNYMTVTFSADVSVVSTGVRAVVTFVPLGACSAPSYITSAGTSIHTNPGLLSYVNGQSCTWTIVAPYGYRPQLVFSAFNTEIYYDYFSVYDGSSSASPALMRRSGSGVPFAVTGSQQYMTVTFTSDSSITYSGVAATVYFV